MTKNIEGDRWIVRTNYLNRSSSFLIMFAVVGAQMAVRGYGVLAWCLVALLFLVYPHLAFLRARRSATPHAAELNNLLVDSFLFGMCAAGLDFPLWICFTLFIGTAITHVLYLGITRIFRSLAAIALGVALTVGFRGVRPLADTEMSAVVLCIIGLSLYLLSLANIAYFGTRKLLDSRAKLHVSEKVLHEANAALQSQLDQIQTLQSQLSEQAHRDPLTGLYNRRYLDTAMARELARCQREGQPLSVLMLDLDFFKRVNDQFGHAAGDEVLKGLATLLTQHTRSSDVACRFGGEEFLVLLPNMSLAAALDKAEQWRQAFAAQTVLWDGSPIRTTLSIGVATFPEHGQTQDALVRSADQALYQAKSAGRDRTVLYRPD
ncbi:MAG TPA: diguanylate cyclase [Rhodoferax sp.]|nr:diguanylate cyclase [Rhodoferax sp.]